MCSTVKLYYTWNNLKLPPDTMEQYLDQLPEEMRRKICRFKRWQDAQASLYGKLLLKSALEDAKLSQSLADITSGIFGKPVLPGVGFNISHTDGLVLCAFAFNNEIGVDTEKNSPIDVSDFKTQFSDDEWREITYAPDQVSKFYNCWTAKEAVLKACGKGLSLPMCSVTGLDNVFYVDGINWYLRSINLFPLYIIQLASQFPVRTVLPVMKVFNQCTHIAYNQTE
ncbi:4'-phosphopantetheinyl transferase superfamily protein [Mucilaginibacter sp. 21P]|uniref:4'-phosphopantetheinyl transferase family protein n=1 Tax=Mucilaginibacter sp. 21P TaxID=2778902 RepID=UPI001C583D81|nr:4'-phosphopantetheinyl transferase superfamily protein [Mucilaginibacter sp. 21P]QXV63858.1 4'-phosphopantetheinyl transferase superfamily protein [Mucilaginibacter sp. 21P]